MSGHTRPSSARRPVCGFHPWRDSHITLTAWSQNPHHITGFRLRYISLHFNFDKNTLFFEDAAALVSLLEPLGASEHRGRGNEENIVAAFNNNGPKNVVLAAPVQKYEDLYALIKAFAA
ncbi:uncharacterized protein RAG0_10857 [Rhynchosporium agropyri]|uniref:Uncharacterized protein n=1 Tax=Rhynchosporium agropyri TaxID=914238 RepID=A0A1E1L1K1_9HELO|nr:uncharacterized protein RAG0_10857 [Rhynchosporium agropyri]